MTVNYVRREDLRRIIRGERTIGSTTEHYWRWPVMLRVRPLRQFGFWHLYASLHGIRDGVARGRGPFHPAVRSMLWIGPIGIEVGWRRQVIEDWRWRRRLRAREENAA